MFGVRLNILPGKSWLLDLKQINSPAEIADDVPVPYSLPGRCVPFAEAVSDVTAAGWTAVGPIPAPLSDKSPHAAVEPNQTPPPGFVFREPPIPPRLSFSRGSMSLGLTADGPAKCVVAISLMRE